MDFQWDEQKRLINLVKHGIDFLDVLPVLVNRPCILKAVYHQERRFIAVGELNNKMITVIYTKRYKTRRIISARRARKNEAREYWERIRDYNHSH